MKELECQRAELRQTRETLKLQHEEQRRLAEAQEARNELEREVVGKRLTVKLFDEWYSDRLVSARGAARAFLSHRAETNEPVWVEDLLMTKWSPEDENFSFALLYRFFDKWARLCKLEQVDGDLLAQLIGEDISEWQFLIQSVIGLGDADNHYAEGYDDIQNLVFRTQCQP